MPERENDLVSLFVRDLDRIELPPRERWRPAQRKESIFMRTSRTILYAGAVAAVLAVALIAGLALRDGGQVAAPPSATPAPSAPTATALPTASPVATSPATTVPASSTRDLFCGVLAANTITSGQGSGPNTFELRPTTSVRTGTVGSARFGGWVSGDRPALGTYVCVWLTQGAPMGGFESQVRSGESGYIAQILPNGFVLPQGCAYIGLPTADAEGLAVSWKVDCGATANRNARGTLGPSFTQQGWVSCASGLASEIWRKDTSRLTVSEGSGAPGEYPTLTQRLFYTGGGGPANAGCP